MPIYTGARTDRARVALAGRFTVEVYGIAVGDRFDICGFAGVIAAPDLGGYLRGAPPCINARIAGAQLGQGAIFYKPCNRSM